MNQLSGQITLFDLDTWSGKTSPERSAATRPRTSGLSSKKQRVSRTVTPLYLDLRKTNGLLPDASWEMGGVLLGEYKTHSFGESPNVAVESRLSQILEDTPHPKYYLSAKAVMGILRRANRRGKELPNTLRRALETQGGIRRDTYGQTEIANAGEVLRTLWGEIGTEAFGEWVRRTSILVQQEKVLLCHLFERGDCRKKATITCADGEEWAATCEENETACPMQCLWKRWEDVGTPQGRESLEQLARKLSSIVHELSRQTAPHESLMCCLRYADEGEGVVPTPLHDLPLCGAQGQGIAGSVESGTDKTEYLTMTGDHQNRVTDYTSIICGDVAGTLDAHYGDKWGLENQHIDAGAPNFVQQNFMVRRLTPLECERLQGFPDGWTDIAFRNKPASDSARYKALGNSIALPPWRFVLSRIYQHGARTLGSLFDGISGFPLIFYELGGKTLWSSEIEPFPIAVAKQHFGDENMEGDIDEILFGRNQTKNV